MAFFGIIISGTLTSPDLVIKGWIAGFLGLFLACVGRDLLQFYPRFTFGLSDLDVLDLNNMVAYYNYINRVVMGLGLRSVMHTTHEATRAVPDREHPG